MKTRMIGSAAIILLLAIAGCYSLQHSTRGTVMMRTATEGYINLGNADGINVGDTLKLFRRQQVGRTTQNICMGEAKVTRILDDKHAAVEPLNGNLIEQDIVEKRHRENN
jgi:hypothetical protein